MVGAPRSFDRIADSYDATRGGEERGERFGEELEPCFGSSGVTLEIGIGTGVVAQALVERGRPVVGIDIAPLMLRHALDRIGPRVAVANAECLPFDDRTVDNAYSAWVLHLVDVAAVLAEVRRVLVASGRYAVVLSGAPDPDPITDAMRPMYDALHVNDGRADEEDRVVALADAAGLTLVRAFDAAPQSFRDSPAQAVELIESRSGSALWDVDDETWMRVVVPAIERLRALPDQNTPIERASRPRILVFER
jgi:SAM-dependent methyltransferase